MGIAYYDGSSASQQNGLLSESDSASADLYNPPTPNSCCGFERHICWSTKLHTIIFLLASFFLLFYSIAAVIAWGFFVYFTDEQVDSNNPIIYLCGAVSGRLISTCFLMIAAITRKNSWILLYLGGSAISLVAFAVGVTFFEGLVWMCTIIPLTTDIAVAYILKQFMKENHLFPMVLAERIRRFRYAVHKNVHSLDPGDSNSRLSAISLSLSSSSLKKPLTYSTPPTQTVTEKPKTPTPTPTPATQTVTEKPKTPTPTPTPATQTVTEKPKTPTPATQTVTEKPKTPTPATQTVTEKPKIQTPATHIVTEKPKTPTPATHIVTEKPKTPTPATQTVTEKPKTPGTQVAPRTPRQSL